MIYPATYVPYRQRCQAYCGIYYDKGILYLYLYCQ